MENSKDNLNKIRNLIIFTILLFLGVQHIDVVFQVIGNLFGLISPFVLGGRYCICAECANVCH